MNWKGQKEDSNTEFLKFNAVDILGWIIFCSGGCPVHCRMFSSIAGVSSLDANAPRLWASLVAQTVKNLPAMWGTWVQSPGWEDPWEEGMATHSSILAWRIPMDRGAWRATFRGVARVRHHWATKHTAHNTQTQTHPLNCDSQKLHTSAGAALWGGTMKLVLQVLEKLQTGFNCYQKRACSSGGETLWEWGSLEQEGPWEEESFFLFQPCGHPLISSIGRA